MKLKPGQFCMLNGKLYRAKRKTAGCQGCAFSRNVFTCPAVINSRHQTSKLDCDMDMIILTKV